MSVYPEAMAEHLAGTVTTLCHCWRLMRKDGLAAGYTDHDRQLEIDGVVFEPESGFSASEARDTLGLATDTVDVEGALSSLDIREEDIAAGHYDGALVETLLVNWMQPSQFARLRTATIGKITRSDQRFVAELESLAHSLDIVRGRHVRRGCDAELGDQRCGFLLSQAGFHGAGTVASVPGAGVIAASGLGGFDSGWFSHGVLTWQSGPDAGRQLRIASHQRKGAEVTISFWQENALDPQTGDAFTIVAGCDKSFATCKAKFANTANFRGFPHLPGNDAGYAYVTDGGRFDGGALVP